MDNRERADKSEADDGRAWIAPDPRSHSRPEEELTGLFPYYDVNFKRWLPTDPGANILDYGCGAGSFLRYLDALGYRNVTGFDVDPRYASFCQSHARARIEQCRNGLQFLRAADGRYDFIFARGVVYYFPRSELDSWFSALACALRRGGRLVIEVFNGATVSGSWPYLNDPYIQTVFSEHSLRYLVQNAGLRVVSLTGEQYPPRGLLRTLWLVGRRMLAALHRVVYLLERGRDAQNPTIFGKSLILVAERP